MYVSAAHVRSAVTTPQRLKPELGRFCASWHAFSKVYSMVDFYRNPTRVSIGLLLFITAGPM